MNRRKLLTALALVPTIPFAGKSLANAPVAGALHSGEFVAYAEAPCRWRSQLETMNAGRTSIYAKSGGYGPSS
jgi:hypothetical protein